MSHELSASVEMDGKHYLFPTVKDGKRLSMEEVVRLFRRGQLKPFGIFDSAEEATAASKKRSREYRPPTILQGE